MNLCWVEVELSCGYVGVVTIVVKASVEVVGEVGVHLLVWLGGGWFVGQNQNDDKLSSSSNLS